MISEKDFQKKVIQTATQLGWKVYFTLDSRRSPAGYPDLTLVRDRVIFAELKTQKGRIKKEQKIWGQALLDAGANYFLWRPNDVEDIIKELTKRGE